MTKLSSVFLLLLALTTTIHAQKTPLYKDYSWEQTPKVYTIQPNQDTLSHVNVKEKVMIEYIYESSGELMMYVTTHTILHINNTKGLEESNKVYISTSNIIEMMEIKARTILKDGKVINLPKSAIKTADNLDNQGQFTYFAMEGAEIGSDIEYIFTKKQSPYLYGSYTMQTGHQKNESYYELVSPKNLVFEIKSYNGLPKSETDTTLSERNKILVYAQNIKAITEEKYSALDASKMGLGFKLAYNYAKSRARLYTFDFAASDFYKRYYEAEKADLKFIPKILKKAEISDIMTDEEKARKLESHLKSTVFRQKDAKNLSFSEMVENKMANEVDLLKLYVHCFKAIGQDVELVITTNRFEKKFDPDFDNWNQLNEALIFLPKLNVFISPNELASRYEFLPPELSSNKGLFIKEISLGDIKSGSSKIKTIGFLDYKKSYHDQLCEVKFMENSLVPAISNTTTLAGYSAYYTQPYHYLISKSDQEKTIESLAKVEGTESTLISSNTENVGVNDILVKPMIVTSKTEASQLIEKAGNKLIFKVGALIGPQAEMYQEGERLTPPEIYYTHSFTRTIKIKIPEGHKAVNLNELNRSIKYNNTENSPCQFTSNCTTSKDEISITVYEDYRQLLYPVSEYEQFKKVINASADFNKLTIVFEK